MKAFGVLGSLLVALASAGSMAQIQIPITVQLPDDDFVWSWGKPRRNEDLERPMFEIRGVEQDFSCRLTGAFKPGSRMGDFENLREFEVGLGSTLYFASESTLALNHYDRENDLEWALLNCFIPDFDESEESARDRVDRAVERAERARERRRQREED